MLTKIHIYLYWIFSNNHIIHLPTAGIFVTVACCIVLVLLDLKPDKDHKGDGSNLFSTAQFIVSSPSVITIATIKCIYLAK